MFKSKEFSYGITGSYALFSDPLTKGGDKYSYSVPTQSALEGVTEAIYWKPTIHWVVDKVRVMNEIKRETIAYNIPAQLSNLEKRDLVYNAYLTDVKYQVLCHYEWLYKKYSQDRKEKKHTNMFLRRLNKREPYRNPVLGTSECFAKIKPIIFGAEKGFYDNVEGQPLGNMLLNRKFEKGNCINNTFFSPLMKKGIITFPNENSNLVSVRNM